jgi:hypothetical protein
MLDLNLLFNLANFFVLPFWVLIIFLPNWGITKKVMASYLPFAVLALLYLYLFVGTFNSESAAAFANPQLPEIARLFGDEKITLTGWVHFIVLDLFVGRYIYWEGQKTGIWTVHSLIFCLFAGPIGLLSHILTVWIRGQFFSPSESDISEASTPTS